MSSRNTSDPRLSGSWHHLRRLAALLLAVIAAVGSAGAEEYRTIIPVFGTGVEGASATYESIVMTTNPHDETVVVRIANAFPLLAVECDRSARVYCGDLNDVPLLPRMTWSVVPDIPRLDSATGMRLGALELIASQPIEVRSEIIAFKSNTHEIASWQSVETAGSWITGRSMIPRLWRPDSDTINLFLVNPNPYEITVVYEATFNSHSATIAPRSSVRVPLSSDFWCPPGCGYGGSVSHGEGSPLELSSDSPYMAAASSSSPYLPPIVRAAIDLD